MTNEAVESEGRPTDPNRMPDAVDVEDPASEGIEVSQDPTPDFGYPADEDEGGDDE